MGTSAKHQTAGTLPTMAAKIASSAVVAVSEAAVTAIETYSFWKVRERDGRGLYSRERPVRGGSFI